MQSIKEHAANVGALAISGMKKTKATAQEKMEKLAANSETEKQMATERKDDRKHEAELHKQESRVNNAAAKQAAKSSTGH
ncbi:Late Embryogenesis Abundant 4-5 [Perilla frutescens var. hirtella]|uniref:Late Embryogenesis Abundant 4-5 n=1 Tax=Perilla frutescens var. hirtella TaxID=608512 RepID=A0AAD4J5F2_PERFH|nr:Late Embryogenesis Abundant 4-5 [Perilla frutescens var. hirtella]